MTPDQNIRGRALNAVAPALAKLDRWLPLSVRFAVAEAVVDAAEPVILAYERARAGAELAAAADRWLIDTYHEAWSQTRTS